MKQKILLVSDNLKHKKLIEQSLKNSDFKILVNLSSSENLLHHVELNNPDAILIEVEVPEDTFLNQIKMVNDKTPKPIIMFTNNSGGTKTIEKVVKAGVHAYVVDGLESERIQAIIETAVVRFKEFQSLRNELIETKATLEDRKIIEKAKGLLMEKHNMNEVDAFKALRKMAMDQNKKMADIADNIVTMFKFI